ncbi:MAG: sugar ABC transporter ATP-binding protein [Actinobacteria bacterium]|nr:sugar ABC transporter ATP-binding protein [Actinomycetota bacterium]
MEDIILGLQNVIKDFPGVRALDSVDFNLKKGEVHALLGENGAGKSTLIKIIMGIYWLNSGKIFLDGSSIDITDTKKAKSLGIDAIYQEQNLCPELTVAENIFVNRLPRRKIIPIVNWSKLIENSQKLLEEWNTNFRATDIIADLDVSQCQIIEIIKVVAEKDLKVLILDEPTAALIEEEIVKLFDTIRKLKSKGISVIYISHRLDEVFLISDRITVLRDGKNVGTLITKDATKKDLVKLMIGRELSDMYPKRKIEKKDVILQVKNLSSSRNFENINFSLHQGEILGMYGLLGSGKSEIGKSLFGRTRTDSGEIIINGNSLKIRNAAGAISKKIGFVPADRKRNGVIDILDVKQNLTLANIKALGKNGFINKKVETERSNKWVKALNIKTPSLSTKISSLSGGNQQKVVIGRWLDSESKILILNEPTHGVDVGAKVEIYNIIEDFCQKGIGVLLISSEIPELTAICDRVIVINRGKINGELSGQDIKQENILRLAMSGVSDEK